MSYKNDGLIESLVESRKKENRRIHDQYIDAMHMRNSQATSTDKLTKTMLADLPEDEDNAPNNFD